MVTHNLVFLLFVFLCSFTPDVISPFALFCVFVITPAFDYPFKLDVAIGIICMKGTMKGVINMTPYTFQSPCLFIILPGQILQYEYFSDDFSGLYIVMSKRFTERLNIQEKITLLFSIHDNPCTILNEKELEDILK